MDQWQTAFPKLTLRGGGSRRWVPFGILLLTALSDIGYASQYQNPIDGKTYRAEWRSYKSDSPVQDINGVVVLKGVRLLAGANDKGLSKEKIEDIVKTGVSNIAFAVGTPEMPFSLLLDIKISRGGVAEVQVASRGMVSAVILRKVQSAAKVVPEVEIEKGPFHYQLELEIKKKPEAATVP
jgi:hypothetical protein